MAMTDMLASRKGSRGGLAAVFGAPSALAAVWIVLVVIGAAGRLWQPAYHVTPMAAIGLVAGAVFASPVVAASVPVAALAVSNLFLPSYGSFTMAVVVFAATAWPALLAFVAPGIREGRVWTWLGGALAHSLVFFLATNLAYWWISDDYPHSAAGLAECFTMALPFYRWMPVGDAAWSLAAFALVRSLAAAAGSRPVQAGGVVPDGGRGVPLD
jgi:hypothetical protein